MLPPRMDKAQDYAPLDDGPVQHAVPVSAQEVTVVNQYYSAPPPPPRPSRCCCGAGWFRCLLCIAIPIVLVWVWVDTAYGQTGLKLKTKLDYAIEAEAATIESGGSMGMLRIGLKNPNNFDVMYKDVYVSARLYQGSNSTHYDIAKYASSGEIKVKKGEYGNIDISYEKLLADNVVLNKIQSTCERKGWVKLQLHGRVLAKGGMNGEAQAMLRCF